MIISQSFYIFGMIALFCVCVVDLFIWLVCEIGEDSRSVSKESEMSVSVDSESCTADVHLPEGGITALAGRCSFRVVYSIAFLHSFEIPCILQR